LRRITIAESKQLIKYFDKGIDSEAFEWFLNIAEQGCIDVFYYIGWFYKHGYGVHRNSEKAFEWFLRAAEQDNGVTQGDAQYEVGYCYMQGKIVKRNPQKAFEWFMKAAQTEERRSQFHVGEYFEFGYGAVEPDINKAREWYYKAAINDHEEAKDAYERLKEPLSLIKKRAVYDDE